MKNRNKWLMAITTCMFATSSAFAQTSLHPWGINLSANYKEFNGEYGNGFWKFLNPNIQTGIGCWRYLNSYFDAGLDLNYGKFTQDPLLSRVPTNPFIEFTGMQIALSGKFKFNNGLMLKEDAFIAPYLMLGVGFYVGNKNLPVDPVVNSKAQAFNLPMGGGVRFNIDPRFQLFLQTCYVPTFIDNFDDNVSGKRNDKIWEHKIGLTYVFGKGKEADSGDEAKK